MSGGCTSFTIHIMYSPGNMAVDKHAGKTQGIFNNYHLAHIKYSSRWGTNYLRNSRLNKAQICFIIQYWRASELTPVCEKVKGSFGISRGFQTNWFHLSVSEECFSVLCGAQPTAPVRSDVWLCFWKCYLYQKILRLATAKRPSIQIGFNIWGILCLKNKTMKIEQNSNYTFAYMGQVTTLSEGAGDRINDLTVTGMTWY